MKRKVIFFIKLLDNISDQYVWDILRHYQTAFDSLVLVCSAKPEMTEFCLRPDDDVLIWPRKEINRLDYAGVLTQIGWDNLKVWDEIVITDDRLMGPVNSLQEMLSQMEKKTELSFWGLTACNYAYAKKKPAERKDDEKLFYIPFRFIVFRKELLNDDAFRDIWERTKDLKNHFDTEEELEYTFTKWMKDANYQWDTYIRTPEDRYDIADFLLEDPVRAVKGEGCPLFLKESFTCSQMKYITTSAGEQTGELLRFLRQETDYDTSMIWKTLIRTEHQDDITRTLRMTYVLPSEDSLEEGKSTQRIALVMHLYYMDLLEETLHYAASMPENADIYIFTCSQEKAEKISSKFSALPNHKKIQTTLNRGRDVGSFLVETADLQGKYDLICFYHDKKSGHVRPHSAGASFAFKTAECVLCTKKYVQNVIRLFEKEPFLGMVSGPTPNHGVFIDQLGNEWGANYVHTRKLAEELKIKVPMAEDHWPAIGLGDVFWYRTRAMEPMFRKKWKYEDFPEEPVDVDGTILHAIERAYPFAVQEAGYLPGRVMPDRLAALEISNLEFYVREYNKIRMEAEINGDIQTVSSHLRQRLSPELLELAKSANFPTQLRLSLERHLPPWLFKMVNGRKMEMRTTKDG